MAAGVSWCLPEAGIVPAAVVSGPVCVPFQVTSRTAVSPLATEDVTVPTASGNAVFPPLNNSMISSGPSLARLLPVAVVEGVNLLAGDLDQLVGGQRVGL